MQYRHTPLVPFGAHRTQHPSLVDVAARASTHPPRSRSLCSARNQSTRLSILAHGEIATRLLVHLLSPRSHAGTPSCSPSRRRWARPTRSCARPRKRSHTLAASGRATSARSRCAQTRSRRRRRA
eukprot:1687308-Prymnesium_polylepis.1